MVKPLAKSRSASRSNRATSSAFRRFFMSPPGLSLPEDSHFGWTSFWEAGQTLFCPEAYSGRVLDPPPEAHGQGKLPKLRGGVRRTIQLYPKEFPLRPKQSKSITMFTAVFSLGLGVLAIADDGHKHGAPLHGGKVAMTKEYHFETVFTMRRSINSFSSCVSCGLASDAEIAASIFAVALFWL